MKNILASILFSLALPATACDLALLLAVDVSGSVDREEYGVQMLGLADAMRDGLIVEALVRQSARVSVLQWSGSSRQKITIPWRQIQTANDVLALANDIERDPRVWRNYSTAIGEAIGAAELAFESASDCERKVLDVSGDGVSNEGIAPEQVKTGLAANGVTINALAIETDQTDLTAYFFESVIAGEGAFVLRSDGFDGYPAAIRRKLRREVLVQLSLFTKK